MSAQAQVDLSRILDGEGGLDASASRQITGILQSEAGGRLSGAELLTYQQNYLACIAAEGDRAQASRAAPWENPTPAQCRLAQDCEGRIMAGVNTCLLVVADEAAARGLDPTPLQADCFGRTSQVAACYRADSQTLPLARSHCDAVSGG
ncbi:MAG: hypothetical protein GC146_13820 [Limimaricola sp.]|uniref:hypothetical protein n=1 Tax=Limimaricola sp. TaxID=2211665 RepID=UPI001D489895|nr:hypothetical protein [Limimaricola sp.]MBI1418294.1 hypothetical protein [Limimaricola sp.]